MKKILYIFWTLIWTLWLFYKIHPVFGTKKRSKYNYSTFKNWKFQNLYIEDIDKPGQSISQIVFKQLFKNLGYRTPSVPIENETFDASKFENNSFVWFGHSTLLMNLKNNIILTDPVFYRASPIAPFWAPFNYKTLPSLQNLPQIDVLLITHDHYDHLDYKSIQELKNKITQFIVPKGVEKHLIQWGIENNKITSLYWYEEKNIWENTFIFTPTQHYSGRRFTNRCETLWGWFIIQNKDKKIYISGDSWYNKEFQKIWEKYGPFDLAFMENGEYADNNTRVHMQPEESLRASQDVWAQLIVPIHWCKFDLSTHAWYDPIEKYLKYAKEKNIQIMYPRIWEAFSLKNVEKYREKWWRKSMTQEALNDLD